jgi:hypothetical protein
MGEPGPSFDQSKAKAFTRLMVRHLEGASVMVMVEVGRRVGLFDTLAGLGPASSAEIAARGGLSERYVREWLGAMVCGGLIEYDVATGTYRLPPEHAASLTGEHTRNFATVAEMLPLLMRVIPDMTEAFRTGAGVPYSAYQPDFTGVMDRRSRPRYDDAARPFDLITAFDAIHDQADPAGVLRRIRGLLAPDGVFVMLDVCASSHLAENVGVPMAPYLYTVSTMHCMSVSLAGGGPGLGAAWGHQVATRMLEEAGFQEVRLFERVDPVNSLYVAR